MNPNELTCSKPTEQEGVIQELEKRREGILNEFASVIGRLERQSEAIAKNPEKSEEGIRGEDFEDSVLGRIDSSNDRMSALLNRLAEVSQHIGRAIGNGECLGTPVNR